MRAVSGEDRPRSAMMKQTLAKRYAKADRFSLMIRRYFFFLNIDSMRCETMKPPKMFTEARTTAMNPNTLE